VIPIFLPPPDLIPIRWPRIGNTMLVQQVSKEIIRPLNPASSNVLIPFDRTIHTVIAVHCVVVSVEGLLRLEGPGPGIVRSLAGKSARGASVRAASASALVVLAEDAREIKAGIP